MSRVAIACSETGEPLLEFAEDRSWMRRALCTKIDTNIFFPERGENAAEARKYCTACVVRPECLEYALLNYQRHGIWGGTSESDRRKLRRQRGLREETNVIDIERWF